ncbi:MAG TPA: hypothetical protein VHW03_08440 [Chthoniobacterales bacterium]|nr:hypothetical protein [Chthoniobacterales bacterium]
MKISAQPAPAYGSYPKNYQEIISDWLASGVLDPKTVVVKWLSEPHPGELTIKGQKISGYLVDFSVNGRNIFGGPTGAQKHTALIRDDKVITATGFVYR